MTVGLAYHGSELRGPESVTHRLKIETGGLFPMLLLKKGTVVHVVLAVWVLVGILGGCASRDARMGSLRLKTKDYEKLLEKQTATGQAQEKNREKQVEMTDEEHERLGDNYFQGGHLERALVHYDKALRMNPDRTSIHHKMGLLFLAKGLNREAIEEFREVLRKEPDNAKAHEGIGLAQFKSGRKEAAERQLRKALELDPKLWKAHTFLGIIYNYRDMPEAAIREHEAALALEPHEGSVYNNLGVSYAFMGDYDNAVRAFEKALRTGTSDKRIYNNLGLVLSKLGRYEEAFEAFRLGGGEAQAYNNLGCVYLERGERDKAIYSFEKAIELKPTYYAKANENLKTARATTHSGSSFGVNAEPEFDFSPTSGNTERDGNNREIGKQRANLEKNRTNYIKVAGVEGRGNYTQRDLSEIQMGMSEKTQLETMEIPTSSLNHSSKHTEDPEKLLDLYTIEIKEATGENPFEPQEESDPTSKSVSSSEYYTVSVGSFRERTRAERYAKRLAEEGLKAFVWEVDLPQKGKWYRVCIGHFSSREKGELFARELQQRVSTHL
jgi:Flp pilus assembly protein TadD